MTDEEPDRGENSNPHAVDKPTEIRAWMEHLDANRTDAMSFRQLALLGECQGLLGAMASGKVVREANRIRECLVEIISLFGPEGTRSGAADEKVQKAAEEFETALRQMTARGIALAPSEGPGSSRIRR